MDAASYPQKRLACFACRDKKLRCNTVRGDVCQRCSLRRLPCQRPRGKRTTEEQETVASTSQLTPPPPPLPKRRKVQPQTNTSGNVTPVDALPIESAERLFWSTLHPAVNHAGSRFTYRDQHDLDPSLDPIACGIVSASQAQHLLATFHNTFGRSLAYFDPARCTFDHVRAHSHALLSVMCCTMARAMPEHQTLGIALSRHCTHVVLPAVLLQGFRSVEVVQAMMMMAAFEPPSESIREDQSWTLLSHAIRIASEINMQAAFDVRDDDYDDHAGVRNAQRTWIHVWLHEFSLAQHTGRRSVLAEQDLFAQCRRWHLHTLAIATDTALVSMVELRTLIKRNRTLFAQLPPHSASFYIEQCKSDLDAWARAWTAASSSSSMPRLELSSLYVHHAMVQLLGLALHSIPSAQWMSTMLVDLYDACCGYLDAFPARLPPHRLRYCYNSMFVAATYEAVVAMRLAGLAQRFTFIDVDGLRARCTRVWQCLDEAARLSPAADAPAHSYARFLHGVLRKAGGGCGEVVVPEAAATSPPPPTTFDFSSSALGFDDLELFAWAGASLAQNDDFWAQLLS